MHARPALILLASLGAVLAGCAPKPPAQRGMFDLSTMPARTSQNQSMPSGHGGRDGGGGMFSTGIGGGGIGQQAGGVGGGL